MHQCGLPAKIQKNWWDRQPKWLRTFLAPSTILNGREKRKKERKKEKRKKEKEKKKSHVCALAECVLHIRNKPKLSPFSIRSKQYCNRSRKFASNHVAPCETTNSREQAVGCLSHEGGKEESGRSGEVGGGFLLRGMDGRKQVAPLSRSC